MIDSRPLRNRAFARPARWRRQCLLWLLLCLCAQASAITPTRETYFFEPGSGRKVTRYDVDVTVDRSQAQKITVPSDCPRVLMMINNGERYRGTVLQRRIWHKVESDCRFHMLLNRHHAADLQDHVSGYDFMNADLRDLPIDGRCTTGPGRPGRNQCTPGTMDGGGLLRYFPLPATTDQPGGDLLRECRLHNGLFHGRLYLGQDGGMACESTARRPTLRLITVDFADIDGDGFLDALLRFVPLGPGVDRSPLILPLTRFSTDAPFHVPGH